MTREGLMQEPLLRCRRIGHVNLYVSDWERSMVFYRDVCGLEEVFREPPIKAGFLSTGNTHHDIGFIEARATARLGRDDYVQTRAGVGARVGFNHFGIEMHCERDLVEGWHRAVAHGIRIEKTTDSSGLSKSVYVRDPDGNLLQFYADLMDDWRSFWALGPRLVTGHWDPSREAAPTTDPHYPVNPKRYLSAVSPVHPLRLTGGTISVADLDGSAAFYALFGLKEVWRNEDGDARLLSASGLNRDLMLTQCKSGEQTGLTRFSFLIPSLEELDRARAWLEERGHAIESYEDQGLCVRLLIRDPDAFGVEFHFDKVADWAAYLRSGGVWSI
ncbi:MAG: VOC family protein [Lautropia sp.]